MTSHALALQEIDKFVKVFQAFNEAKHAIIALASLDQNTKELEVHLEDIKGKVASAKDDLEKSITLLKEEKEKGVLENKSFFEQEKKKSATKLAKMQDEFDTLLKQKEEELKNVLLKTDYAKTELSSIQDKIAARKIEVASLEARHAEIRKQITELLK